MKLQKIFITTFIIFILMGLSCSLLFPPIIEEIIKIETATYNSDEGTATIEFTWLDPAYTLNEITVHRYFIDRWEEIDTITGLTFFDPIELANTSYTLDHTEEGYKYKYAVTFSKEDHTYTQECNENVWIPVRTDVVWYTDTGDKYHRHSCHYLYSVHSATRAEAIAMGLTACSVCRP